MRLSRFGSHAPGDFKPSPITVFISATSSMQARTNAQASHPGYDVTDVHGGMKLGDDYGIMDAGQSPALTRPSSEADHETSTRGRGRINP